MKFLHATNLVQEVGDNTLVNVSLKMVNEQLGQLRVSTDATLAALGWLSDKAYFVRLNEKTIQDIRVWLRFQIAELDWFLATKGGLDAFCACANLIWTTPYVLTTAETDPTTDVRPTYIRCKAKYLLPQTLEEYDMPWEFDPQDPSYILILKYIDHDLQNQLFDHTAAIILGRRNAATAWKSNWSFHTNSVQGGSTATVSSNNEIFPGEATNVSVGDLSGRRQRRRHVASVSSWNEKPTARPEIPPAPSTPSSHWSGPSYGAYDGHLRRMYGRDGDVIVENGGNLDRHSSAAGERGDTTGRAADLASDDLSYDPSAHASASSKHSGTTKLPDSEASSASAAAPESLELNDPLENLQMHDPTAQEPSDARPGSDLGSQSGLTRHAIHRLNVQSGRVANEHDEPYNRTKDQPTKLDNDSVSHGPHDSQRKSNSTASQNGRGPADDRKPVRASLLSSSRSTKGVVKHAPDPKMKSMDTLLFFRAVLVTSLLASGADSTLLLRSEKRYQVVQVL